MKRPHPELERRIFGYIDPGDPVLEYGIDLGEPGKNE